VPAKKNISDLPLLRHYDKLLVVVALVVLLISLAYLIKVSMAHEDNVSEYEQSFNRQKPKAPPAEAVSLTAYENAARQLEEPFKVSVPDRKLANFLAPECRVSCMNEACKKPIPEKATICPFCGDKQEVVERTGVTTVGVVPDVIKRALRLSITDISVESLDLGGDGFTVREKWEAGIDMVANPKARPPYTEKLQVRELRGKKLSLRFTAVNKMPDGSKQLTLNWTDKKNPRTYWVKENQPIGETGFTAGEVTEKVEERDTPAGKRPVDVSTVIVKRVSDGKEIELQIGELEKNTDVEAILVFLVDDSELTLLEKQEFKLRDETYRVVSINERDTKVVVENTATEKQATIEK
jgi:RNA polymerase subunit RPABC4/transcription elongation factor Spt4